MVVAWSLLSLLVGFFFGYLLFYFRYENRELINQLRKHNKSLSKELEQVSQDAEEYKQQNIILREKTVELLRKNDDLTKIVSELQRYYYHVKVAAEKVQELANFLQLPDEKIVDRIKQYNPETENEEASQVQKQAGKKEFF